MAVNSTITNTSFTDTITAGETIIKAIHINELNDAIERLSNLKENVNNCDCDVCTSNCCQTCQTISYTCQSNCTCSNCCGH